MKSWIRLALAACALAGAGAAFATGKARTYKVVGYYDHNQPKTELVAQAASEIGAKMKDCVAVQSEDEADQVVQILFKRDGTYRIYWDALPLAKAENRYKEFEKPLVDPREFRAQEGKSGEFPPK